jgi:hypothetical protein
MLAKGFAPFFLLLLLFAGSGAAHNSTETASASEMSGLKERAKGDIAAPETSDLQADAT